MENQLKERLDSQEEITDQLVKHSQEQAERIAKLETKADSYPKVYAPDHSAELAAIRNELKDLNDNYKKENFDARCAILDKRIDAVPKVIPVEHHHHFNPKSKWMFIIYFLLVVVVSVFCGLTIGFGWEVHTLSDILNTRNIQPVAPVPDEHPATEKPVHRKGGMGRKSTAHSKPVIKQ
jgi:hypothetical protein